MIGYEPLKRIMKEKSISSEVLAEKAGISRASISRMFNGGYNTKTDTINKLCSALECNISDIVEFKRGEKEPVTYHKLKEKCRLDRSSLNKARQRNGKVRSWTLGLMCGVLGCTEEDVCDD